MSSVFPPTIRALPATTEPPPSFRIALIPDLTRTPSSKTIRTARGAAAKTAPFSGTTRTRVACAHPAAGKTSEQAQRARRAQTRNASRKLAADAVSFPLVLFRQFVDDDL